MYSKVYSPIENKFVNINSRLGYKILSKYAEKLGIKIQDNYLLKGGSGKKADKPHGMCGTNPDTGRCHRDYSTPDCVLEVRENGRNQCVKAKSSKPASTPVSVPTSSLVPSPAPIPSPIPTPVSEPSVPVAPSSPKPISVTGNPYFPIKIINYESMDGSIITERIIDGLPIEIVVEKWNGRQLNNEKNIKLIKGYIFELYYPFVGYRIRNFLDRIDETKKDGVDGKLDLLNVLKKSYEFINSSYFDERELMTDETPFSHTNHPYGSIAKAEEEAGSR